MDHPTDLDKIAERAQQIYDEQFRQEYESKYLGQFVAIDIKQGNAYLGEFAEDALSAGRAGNPHGVFHLIRVGSAGAFRSSYASSQETARYW